jgi:hypothetical protein
MHSTNIGTKTKVYGHLKNKSNLRHSNTLKSMHERAKNRAPTLNVSAASLIFFTAKKDLHVIRITDTTIMMTAIAQVGDSTTNQYERIFKSICNAIIIA